MGIGERKKREKEALRQKILMAAEELFIKEGYENVSMRKIATKIEYSTTVIYKFFKTKEEMMQVITSNGYQSLSEMINEIKISKSADPLSALQEITRGYIKCCLKDPKHWELWYRFSDCDYDAQDGFLYMDIGSERYKIFHSWIPLIEACIKKKIFKEDDPLHILYIIWAAIYGLIALRTAYPKIPWPQEDEHINSLVTTIFAGFKRNKTENK